MYCLSELYITCHYYTIYKAVNIVSFITSILKLLLVNTCIFEIHALWRKSLSSSDEVWVTINLSELQTSLNYKHLLISNNISELQTSPNYKQHLWIANNISELQTSLNYKHLLIANNISELQTSLNYKHLLITNNISELQTSLNYKQYLGLTNNISELLTTFWITNNNQMSIRVTFHFHLR